MAKTETIHTRVSPDIKREAESIFESIGLTTSQAIMLFLTATVNHNGLPFELSAQSKEERDFALASAIATVDGIKPNEDTKRLFMLYKRGEIDLETAKFAIKRLYK